MQFRHHDLHFYTIQDCITFAQRYIRPTILRTYPHVVFQQLLVAVGPMNCMWNTHPIEKKVVHPTYCKVCCTLTIGWMQTFRRSDEQPY